MDVQDVVLRALPGYRPLIVWDIQARSAAKTGFWLTLAGGNLTSNGNNTVEGAVVSGLNVELGQSLPPASVGNGTKVFQYNSCNVTRAMAQMAQLVGYSNAWVDNWPTY